MMKKQVNIGKFPYFKDTARLQRLNRQVKLHSDLMPHQISTATGCTLKEAMVILMLLYHKNLVELFLVIYHISEPDSPILIRKIDEGLPSLPFLNPLDETEITDSNEITYDFLFKLPANAEIEFVFGEYESDRSTS